MPRRVPYIVNGQVVPGVTTITGRFKEADPLMAWAYKQGKEGKDFREERDAAAAAGTLAHALVEAHLRGENYPLDGIDPEILSKGFQGFENWCKWKRQTRLEITPWEKPLVCEHHLYGGTPDALVTLDGLTVVADWKTSAGGAAYVEHLCQIAAYAHLFEDAGHKLAEGYHLCTFSRDTGDFVHHYFSDLDDAWRLFLMYRGAYELDKTLQRRVK